MGDFIFEIIDKSGRKLRLTRESWKHITTNHGEMTNYLDEIQRTIENPLKIILHPVPDLRKYFSYIKHRKRPERYLRIVVKYLNNHGFILTAHFVATIR